jgi:hypothetical protein
MFVVTSVAASLVSDSLLNNGASGDPIEQGHQAPPVSMWERHSLPLRFLAILRAANELRSS